MKIRKLFINNVRNHVQNDPEFCDNLNILYGLNGSGKTSVLEGISICSMSKSFLPVSDNTLINKDADFCQVSVQSCSDLDIPYHVKVRVEKGKRKKIDSSHGDWLNPKDIIGEIPTVVLSPDFKPITHGSPADRRQFLDKVLSQSSKVYIENILNLKKSLKQRNNLLNDISRGFSLDEALMESWAEMLIKTSAEIVVRRFKFINEFRDYFKELYRDVSEGREEVDILYKPDSIDGSLLNDNISKEEIIKAFRDTYKEKKRKEYERGTTQFGPQKDEVIIKVNGGTAKDYASQGQHKSLLISIKFAEFRFLKDSKGETPVILLDDIFSELDSNRAKRVIDLVLGSAAQTFVTVTDLSILSGYLPKDDSCSFYKVEKGEVTQQDLSLRLH